MSKFTTKYEETMIASNNEIGTWGQLAESLYEFLNRRNTTIEYSFDNMVVGVPKETGPDSPQANWKLNGTLRIRTWEV
jgi:hypothetical protein